MNHDSISDHENQSRDVLLFNTWRKPPLYPGVAEPLSAIEATLMEVFIIERQAFAALLYRQ